MFFWNKICGIILIFLFICSGLRAQTAITFSLNNTNFHLKNKLSFLDDRFLAEKISKTEAPLYSRSPIPANFSTLSYGFFCRKELAIEKATKIPFRFRLGSLEQCNYYEGKK